MHRRNSLFLNILYHGFSEFSNFDPYGNSARRRVYIAKPSPWRGGHYVLQPQKLLFLCVKFFLSNNATIKQFFIFFQFHSTCLINNLLNNASIFFLDGLRANQKSSYELRYGFR